MPTHLALLRGVNVGGRRRLAMADLRAVAEGLGHADVATYIQSGNLVLTPRAPAPPPVLATELEQALAELLEPAPRVVVLTAADLDAVVAGNPYSQETDPRHVHAVVRQHPLTAAEAAAAQELLREHRDAGGPDHLTVAGAVCYLHTPHGLGRSRLAERLSRTEAAGQDVATTMRSWATVLRLQQLLGG